MWRVYVAIIIINMMWILYLYKRIADLEEEKREIIQDTIKEINKIRKMKIRKEVKKNVK